MYTPLYRAIHISIYIIIYIYIYIDISDISILHNHAYTSKVTKDTPSQAYPKHKWHKSSLWHHRHWLISPRT